MFSHKCKSLTVAPLRLSYSIDVLLLDIELPEVDIILTYTGLSAAPSTTTLSCYTNTQDQYELENIIQTHELLFVHYTFKR